MSAPLSETLDDYERTMIRRALSVSNGNVTDAARRLKTDRPNLYTAGERHELTHAGTTVWTQRPELRLDCDAEVVNPQYFVYC
jgi:hypothetical protein